MLTKSGTKLLDFGLAKLRASPVASPLSQLPTADDSITAQGKKRTALSSHRRRVFRR
jgi:hypothetical protein